MKTPMSAEEWFRVPAKSIQTVMKDMEDYANYKVNHHLEQFAEKCKEKIICGNCGGYGYTVEVEAECCGNGSTECCGIPNPIQVQKQCSCYQGVNIILPNNIDQTLTDYKYKNNINDTP